MYCTVGRVLLPASECSLIDVESLLNTASSSSFVAINSWKLYKIYSENLCFITYVPKEVKLTLKCISKALFSEQWEKSTVFWPNEHRTYTIKSFRKNWILAQQLSSFSFSRQWVAWLRFFCCFQVSMNSCLPSRKLCLSQLTRRDFFLTLLFSTIVFVCKDAKLQSCIKLFLNWPIKMAVDVLSYIYFFETMSASSRALPFWLGLHNQCP